MIICEWIIRKIGSKKFNYFIDNIDLTFLQSNLATMREIKTEEELKLLTKAVRISAIGQNEVMKARDMNSQCH